jgi:hypothetical protein
MAVAGLTAALVWATISYVNRTREMAAAMRRSNELTEDNMLRLARQGAARLTFELPNGKPIEGVDDVSDMVVTNQGRGAAHEVVLQLDGMLVEVGYIPSGAKKSAHLPVPFSFPIRVLDPPAKPPRYIGVDHRDDAGDVWIQEWWWGRGLLGPAIPPTRSSWPAALETPTQPVVVPRSHGAQGAAPTTIKKRNRQLVCWSRNAIPFDAGSIVAVLPDGEKLRPVWLGIRHLRWGFERELPVATPIYWRGSVAWEIRGARHSSR